MGEHLRQAVFVDRDGVICRNRRDHVKSWHEFAFLPGALDALTRLADSDLRIVVVTNQAAINRGMVAADVVEDIHDRMVHRVKLSGGRIDGVVYCPHRPDEHCLCRKPQPGMILSAAEQLGLDVSGSYLVGDARADVMAGQAAGCARSYLVLTGRGIRQLAGTARLVGRDVRVVLDLRHAVSDILRSEARAGRLGRCGTGRLWRCSRSGHRWVVTRGEVHRK